MSYSQNTKFGYLEDTATDLTIGAVPALNYANHFAVKENGGNSVVLANTSSPMGWPETLKFQIQDVANIYNNSDVDPVLYAPSKKGKSLLCSINDTIKVGTGADAVMYPISAHFVLKFPNTADVETADIMTVAKRMVALAFNGADDNTRLGKLIHGALNPIQ